MTLSNSSCLISLEAIGKLDLLSALYGAVLVPEAVLAEWGGAPPAWLTSNKVANVSLVQSLRNDLGGGEAETIALALEVNAQRVILDDKKARRFAVQFGLPVTGTLGIVLQAKKAGMIALVGPVLDDLIQAGFHLSIALKIAVLQKAGE